MPAAQRRVDPSDIVPEAHFARERKQRRAAMAARKRLRRIAVGPWCTFYFETYETMLFQIQEMLLIEKGGAAQLADELAAYNPLIPQGDELVATIMFEIDDPVRRQAILAELGGVEERFLLQTGADLVRGRSEDDLERTRSDGKASSVHFVRFALSQAEQSAFVDCQVAVAVGCDHPRYSHLAILPFESRLELASDFRSETAS
ncbi:MAG: DUF3501 family protein [Caulobacteraceae bacterium]